ncbi:DUF4373 domain-containing protein [Paenibacillus qinlingensis]|uniref:Lin1244/Lin1753-like N-terminal domain-containing protein n=1 Tax=Paenibacillus qinlingensis TaxID=1837343 RepID=A0ABU1P6S6_9BACL|nr:DUF4373 domain-containing protein [Paenibacillus qinlingensis]MDR6555466.1 hypothetical protein [Paenibacillus qinlingensis]
MVAKDIFYFSHDSNARRDPKIVAMRGVYGSLGYAWYFMFIEMMREADGYRLEMKSKYAFNAYASEFQCERITIEEFVHDCVEEFNLFSSDGTYFWSESLMKRMDKVHEKSEKAKKSAAVRWKKSDRIANASKSDAINKSKVNEIKDNLLSLINQSEIKYEKDEQLEIILSFVNVMDVEVIEDVINRSKGNHINYVKKALRNRMNEGNTKKESIKPAFVSHSEKEAVIQQRLAEERKEAIPQSFKPEFEEVSA